MKEKRALLIISIIFFSSFTSLILLTTNAFSLSPFESHEYILANDLIKNFEFEKIGDELISPGGAAHDNKLKFEVGGAWNLSKDDLELIKVYELENEQRYFYKVTMHNKINIYTNVPLRAASSKPIQQKSSSYTLGTYKHRGSFGDVVQSWSKSITFYHYDFGNIREHNSAHNTFTGDLKMSFDIQQSLLPNTWIDSAGNTYDKSFDYIGVSSAYVESQESGQISDTEPGFVVQTPDEYSQSAGNADSSAESRSSMEGYSNYWSPDVSLKTYLANKWSEMQPGQSVGSSLNPEKKDGSPTYDNTIQEQASQKDCAMYYNIGRISPVVKEYYASLSYDEMVLETIDKYIDWKWKVRIYHEDNHRHTQTKPAALHVNNQYIQVGIAITFNLYSSYDIETKDTNEGDVNLETPEEDTEDQLWSIIVDGWGGGETYQAAGSPISDIIRYALYAAIIISGIIGAVLIAKYAIKVNAFQKISERIKN